MEWNDRMEKGSKCTQLQLTCVTGAAYSCNLVYPRAVILPHKLYEHVSGALLL